MKSLPDAIWVSGQALFIFMLLVLNTIVIFTYLCWWRQVGGDMTKSRDGLSLSQHVGLGA